MTTMNKSKTDGNVEAGNYVQLFMYRVPKKNHKAMIQLQGQITDMWKRLEILGSEFFQLSNAETFKGFTNLAETVSANGDDEVWVELQRYRDRKHRDEIVAKIRADSTAGPLFGQFYGLVVPGQNSIMGDFNRLSV